MRIFNLIQKGWLRRKKVDSEESMLLPLTGDNLPAQVDHEERPGNGSFIDSRLVTVKEPYSIAAEQYRVLCTRILHLKQDKPSYVLAVTSSVKAEGKSFTALNLAISMARDFDERVLLIEGDLKNPVLHDYLKHPPGFGLTDVLAEKIDFNVCSLQMFEGKLTVLLAGKIVANTSRLIASQEMQDLLNSVRGHYKYVIIDTPPIIPMADINIYSPLVDGILLIIRAGKTPRSVIKRALVAIPPEKVVGAVLNEVEPHFSKYYYNIKYSY